MFKLDERYLPDEDGQFYSCNWIQSGIVFFQHKLTMCCYCGHEGGGHVMLGNNYKGQELNWDRIFWLKKRFNDFHKKGLINTNCKGCPYLKKDNWELNRKFIDRVYISHWTYCNSKCFYCYATEHPEEFYSDKTYSVLPILKDMIKKKILKPGGDISFGGGEPTILTEFDDIIKLLLNNKFYNLRIHTSGIRYSKVLEKGIREGRINVVVSTDAGSEDTYKKIKRVNKYSEVRENIKKYAKAQRNKTLKVTKEVHMAGHLMVGSKFIIIPGVNDTIEEVESWFRENEKANVHRTIIDLEENWYKANKYNVPEHIFELVEYIKRRSKELNTNFEMYERLENLMKIRADK